MTSLRDPVQDISTLAAADDLNGDATTELDVTGRQRVVIVQKNSGTAGTAGIDVIEFSRDDGSTWAALTSANCPEGFLKDDDGDAVASAALNAAGTEPSGAAVFTCGPFDGAAMIRCSRGAAGGGTAWVTGAPAVQAVAIG